MNFIIKIDLVIRKRVVMKNREDLNIKWKKLVSKYSDNEILINDTLNLIRKCYNTSNRYYHNLDHIKNMLSEVKKFKTMINNYNSVLFAIWFHDVIYDAKKSDNEEKSSELAEEFLENINYDKEKIKKIKNLILKTKNHSNFNSNEDFDTKLFLDLDLLILGANNEMYRKYAEKIRKEYSFVPHKIYNIERIRVLENFLSQEYTFRTKRVREIYEKMAKYNIKSETKFLSKV